MFLVISENDFEYTTSEETPELTMKVTDPNGNLVQEISGLSGTNGVYDITTKRGTIAIATDYEITGTRGNTTSQEWTVEIELVNLNSNQNQNQGKTFTGKFYLSKDSSASYIVPEVSGLNVTNSETSIETTMNLKPGNVEVDKYYFGIEEVTEPTAYKENYKVVRLANQNKNITYIESENNNHTFSSLTSNKNYNVYAYIVDKNGFRSNIYSTKIKATNDILPKVNSVTTTKGNKSITLTANTVQGTNNITTYAYSIDNGATWQESTNNTYTYNNLKYSRTYDIKIKAVDSTGLESTLYYESIETDGKGPSFAEYIMNVVYTGTDGENNIYKHDGVGSYTNASEEACWLDNGITKCDNSYRYSGASAAVNNYVCFGYSDPSVCKASNFTTSDYAYRIIGVFNENDGSAGTNSYQVKLIKNTWLTTYYIGEGQNYSSIDWYWDGVYTNTQENNTWGDSTLNTDALNTRYVNALGSTWSNLIENHIWKVGGNIPDNITYQAVKTSYANEIINPVSTYSTDGRIISPPTKIGLLYVSDYGYAASPDYWQTNLSDFRNYNLINWMYKGEYSEWTITRYSNNKMFAYAIVDNGYINYPFSVGGCEHIRPVFYLKSSVMKTSGTGASTDPYMIG